MFAKLKIFLKAQVSAMIGGAVDYLIMIFFTEFFHVHYTISIAIGGIIGAVINFALNKKWSFKSRNYAYKNSGRVQFMKFVLVVLNSITLKSLGTFIVTSNLKIDYKISRIVIDLIVSILFNYTLQKQWVFKKLKKEKVTL
jgi:putative flippase GtrA